MKKKILVNFLSGQIYPNLIATINIKPDKVYSLDTGEYSSQNESFKIIARVNHQKIEYRPYDLPSNKKALESLMNKHSEDDVIVNITGGTKIMIAPVFSLSQKYPNIEFCYVDTTSHKILFFTMTNNDFSEVTFKDFDNELSKKYFTFEGDNKNIFFANNIQTRNIETKLSGIEEGRIEITQKIFDSADENGHSKLISFFNREVTNRDVTNKKSYDCEKFGWKDGSAFFIYKNKKELFCYGPETGERETEAVKYLTGGWFEEFVFEKLKNKFGENFVAKNVIINNETNNRQDQNEIDCMIISNYESAIIEVKSGKVTQDHLFKLHSLRQKIGGTFGKAILISYFSQKENPTILQQAKDLKIELIHGKEQCEQLGSKIKNLFKHNQ